MSKHLHKETTLYDIFDVDRKNFNTRFSIVRTSKRNIIEICKVLASNESLTDESRSTYARQAGLPKTPIKDENGKINGYEHDLDNMYDEYTATAALAEVLFKGCPQLIDVADETVSIIDKELFDSLDEGAVNRAFVDFQLQRKGTKNPLLL